MKKKNYLNDKHYNNINNNIIANNYRNHHHIQNDNKNSNDQSLSKPRSVTLLKTRLLPNAHNKFSPEVINRTLADIGENLTHVVAIEQSRSSSGSINKDKKYKLNKKKYKFSRERKSCYTNDVSPLISQQTIDVANLDRTVNIHNQFNNERNNKNTTIMREYNSVRC